MELNFSAKVIQENNLVVLGQLPEGCIDLIYIDPPFNTGKVQSRTRIRTTRGSDGDRIGFKGKRYK
ncbi:MAG: site-specific DNA-methyltransferase, partial [Chloroflexota bacterium]